MGLAAGRELSGDCFVMLSPTADEGDGGPIPLCGGTSGASGMGQVGRPSHAHPRDTPPITALLMKPWLLGTRDTRDRQDQDRSPASQERAAAEQLHHTHSKHPGLAGTARLGIPTWLPGKSIPGDSHGGDPSIPRHFSCHQPTATPRASRHGTPSVTRKQPHVPPIAMPNCSSLFKLGKAASAQMTPGP